MLQCYSLIKLFALFGRVNFHECQVTSEKKKKTLVKQIEKCCFIPLQVRYWNLQMNKFFGFLT